MARPLPTLALPLLAVLAIPTAAAAQAEGGRTVLTFTSSLAGGGEMGLSHGKGGVLELEAAGGVEWEELGLRAELGASLGIEPDTHVALRPGVRYRLPGLPLQLRGALDLSNSRASSLSWRWLLVGLAAEVRITSTFGVYGEVDTGAPLSHRFGLPLLIRGGASFRF